LTKPPGDVTIEAIRADHLPSVVGIWEVMTAVSALDPGKDVEEIAVLQIPLHILFDMGAKEVVYLFDFILTEKNRPM
jgi:hypothetical protein